MKIRIVSGSHQIGPMGEMLKRLQHDGLFQFSINANREQKGMGRWGRIQEDQAVFILIDVQEGLFKAMDEQVRGNVIRNVQTLLSLAKEMAIPVMTTEQYPRGLGATVAEVKEEFKTEPI